jgi:ribose 5-phosphate isomerase RpiB
MKVYLISDASSGGEEMLNVFDQANVNVVSKEVRANIERVSQNFQNVAVQGNSDIMVLVTNDSIEASIELNKKEEIRAAVCNSAEDVERAREKDVNLIIVPNEAQKKDEIAEAIIRTGKGAVRMLSIAKVRDKRRQESVNREEEEEERRSRAKPESKPEPEERVEETTDEEEEESRIGNRKGIIGKIKDSLGIID